MQRFRTISVSELKLDIVAVKRDRSSKLASDENRLGKAWKESPDQPYDAGEKVQEPYKGYDEDRTSFNPEYEKDFDVDENEIRPHKDENSDVYNQSGPGSNTRSSTGKRNK